MRENVTTFSASRKSKIFKDSQKHNYSGFEVTNIIFPNATNPRTATMQDATYHTG